VGIGIGERKMMFIARRGEDSVTERTSRRGVREDMKPCPMNDMKYGRDNA